MHGSSKHEILTSKFMKTETITTNNLPVLFEVQKSITSSLNESKTKKSSSITWRKLKYSEDGILLERITGDTIRGRILYSEAKDPKLRWNKLEPSQRIPIKSNLSNQRGKISKVYDTSPTYSIYSSSLTIYITR